MNIQEQVSLKPYNTFGIEAAARFFVEVKTEEELIALCKTETLKYKKYLILGGGSNILFTKDFDGLVIKNSIQGLEFKKSGQLIRVTAGAGMNWHELVLKTLENGAHGLENLSLIPGTVGGAPVQNIGAYGVEIKDVFEQLKAIEINTGKVKVFTKDQCLFNYRYSVFKDKINDKYIITEVTFDLHKSSEVNSSYADLKSTLLAKNITNPTPQDISDAVIAIRQSKLPDPSEIGNAGSFFKNPVIEKLDYSNLQSKFNGFPGFPQTNNKVKVPAAWLIEQTGWKGKKVGEVGVNPKQPLVLVNYGAGTGKQIKELAIAIQKSVKKQFGITLEPEVNMI